MNRLITQKDILLLSQQHKQINVRLLLLDNTFTTIQELSGALRSLSLDINADSDVRRSGNLEIIPDFAGYDLVEQKFIPSWINRYMRVFLDYLFLPSQETLSYCIGTFVLDTKSFSFDSENNSLSINLIDLMATLDGSHGGEMGAETITIKTGQTLQNAMSDLIRFSMEFDPTFGNKTWTYEDFQISPISEYRDPTKDEVPYEMEFPDGCTILEVITKIRDLYPGYETYFDEYGGFHCNRIPTCKNDSPVLTAEHFEKDVTVYSENRDYTYTGIYNIAHVYGKVWENIDIYADKDNCTFDYDSAGAHIVQKDITEYKENTYLAMTLPEEKGFYPSSISINDLPVCQTVVDTDSTAPSASKYFSPGETYIFRYEPLESGGGRFRCLGTSCANALSVLISQEPGEDIVSQYRQTYHCSTLSFVVDPDNPFTVDKIGRRYKRLNDDTYTSLETSYEALDAAEYYLWQSARLTNSLSITCDVIPFLDVNQKFTYRHFKPLNTDTPNKLFTYITKQLSVSINESEAQMTITASAFNELYPDIIKTFDPE